MRVEILCEDRRTERFVRRVCDRQGAQVLPVHVAPEGKGDASAWVLSRYAELARKRRSKNFQKSLGLLVVIDGDNRGVAARKQQLDDKLREAGIPLREPEESIATIVPTWSIETWLAHLSGLQGVTEMISIKEIAPYRELWRDGTVEAATTLSAAGAWRGAIPPLPSLAAAYAEARRVGL